MRLFVNNTINGKSHCFLTLAQNIKLLLNNIKDNRLLETRSPNNLYYSQTIQSFSKDYSLTYSHVIPDSSLIIPGLLPPWSQTTNWLFPDHSLIIPRLLPSYSQTTLRKIVPCNEMRKRDLCTQTPTGSGRQYISARKTHTAFTAKGC